MKVGSLDSVTIGGFAYVFIIVVWDDYRSPIRTDLEKQSEAFGTDLGSKVSLRRVSGDKNGGGVGSGGRARAWRCPARTAAFGVSPEYWHTGPVD